MKTKQNKKKSTVNTEKQVVDWHDKYLRAVADYQNLENRTNKQINEDRKNANKYLLVKLLDLLDDIEAAEIFIKDEGLKLIKDKLLALLREEGVEEIDLLHTEYDPNYAECIEVIPGEKDNIVETIVKKGYLLNSNLFRVAKVKVTKKI